MSGLKACTCQIHIMELREDLMISKIFNNAKVRFIQTLADPYKFCDYNNSTRYHSIFWAICYSVDIFELKVLTNLKGGKKFLENSYISKEPHFAFTFLVFQSK